MIVLTFIIEYYIVLFVCACAVIPVRFWVVYGIFIGFMVLWKRLRNAATDRARITSKLNSFYPPQMPVEETSVSYK